MYFRQVVAGWQQVAEGLNWWLGGTLELIDKLLSKIIFPWFFKEYTEHMFVKRLCAKLLKSRWNRARVTRTRSSLKEGLKGRGWSRDRHTRCLLFVSYGLSEEDGKCLWARLKYNCEAESVLYLSNRFSLWGKVRFLSFQVAHRTRGFITTNPCFLLIYFRPWPRPPLLSSPHWFTSPPWSFLLLLSCHPSI